MPREWHGSAALTPHDRPRLHIHPERGWLNDPNGLCRIDEIYHVFYQYNPAGPVHANIHWGHASSPDLVHWTTQPVALTPNPTGPDRGGCWSGCIVDDGGIPTAVYTAVADSSQNAGVALARSDRTLLEWRADGELQVGVPSDPAISDVRDPFVFVHEGHRYAVQGAGHVEGRPQLLLYGCDDLTNWVDLGPLLTSDDPIAAATAPANIWECPNLFRLGDTWVVLLSLWRTVNGTHQLSGVRYLLGGLLPRPGGGLQFVTRSGGTVDTGPAFYAPQVLVEADGRVLLWGWAWETDRRSRAEIEEAGWSGALTFPRELTLEGEVLRSRPAGELIGLRREPLTYEPGAELRTDAFDIEASNGLQLLLVDRTSGHRDLMACVDGPARLLVDGSLIELFGEGPSFTTRAYPNADRHWVVAAGGPIKAWRLGLAGSGGQ